MRDKLKTATILLAVCFFALASPVCAQDTFREVHSKHNGIYFTPPDSRGNIDEYVGDPMPFYDSKGKLFRIFYLRDRRNRDDSLNYHPISQVTTADVMAYKEVKDGDPILPFGVAGSNDPSFGTGSVIYNENSQEYVMYYTGHDTDKEVVLRAFSNDGVNWTKNNDRIIKPADNGYDAGNFRDPFVLKLADNDYRMIVSTQKDRKAVLAEYKSTGLWDWKHVGVFRNTPDCFHECVDIFQSQKNGLWYLVYSDINDRHVKYYVSKTYDGLKTASMPYKAEGKLDGKSFYAGKTASDGTNRYIWGWCATRNGQQHTNNEAPTDWGGTLVYHQLVPNVESDDINLSSIKVKCPDILKGKIKAETYWQPEDQTETYKDEVGNTQTRGYFNLTSGKKVSLPRLYPTNRVTFTVRGSDNGEFGLRFIDCKDHDTYSIRIGGEGENKNRIRLVKDSNPNENINQLTMLDTDVENWFKQTGFDITVVTDNSVCVVYVNDSYAFTNRIYGMEGNPFSLFYTGNSADSKIKVSNLKVYTTEISKVLWDGEDRELGTQGGLWDDNSPKVVENPDKTGINKSGKCLKYTANGRQEIQIPFRDWLQDFDLKGNRRLSFMIKKPSDGNVVMELAEPTNGADGYWAKTFAWYEKANEWQKVAFDFTDNTSLNDYPGVMTIYASLDEKEHAEDIYIDNVIVEPLPTVGGVYVGDCKDHDLNGRIVLGGSWMRGECTNFDAFEAIDYSKKRYYDDYAILQNKLTKGVYEVDMRKATVHGIYDNNIAKVNPNCIIYASADNKPMVSDTQTADNLVVGDKDAGHADRFVLDEGYPFHCTEDFTARDGLVKRRMTKGYWNTMLLPFYIKGEAYKTAGGDFLNYLGGTYAKMTGERRHANGNVTILFTTFTQYFDANVPFLVKAENTNGEGDGYNEFKFQDIKICKTPEFINCRPEGVNVDFIGNYSYNPDTDYTKGVFLPVGSLFLYNDTFKHVVKENANTTKPLRGYFQVYDVPASSKMMFSVDYTPTSITDIDASANAANDNWYTIQGMRISKPQQDGIYINNGKKVIIKK